MAKEKINTESVNNVNDINAEVARLTEELKGIKEKIYTLNKEKKVDDLTKQLDKLNQYKDNYVGLIKHIKEEAVKEQRNLWRLICQITSGVIGFGIIVFYAVCAWKLLFLWDTRVSTYDSIPLLISGICLLLFIAVVFLLFCRNPKR